MKTGYNALSVKIFSSGITEVIDVDGSIANAQIESFETMYPGGIFGPATIKCPRDVTRSWLVKEHQRAQILNGLTVVWEGEILSIGISIEADAQYNTLNCVGYYGSLWGARLWDKRWADARLSDDVWVVNSTLLNGTIPAMSMARDDREGRLRIEPDPVPWGSSHVYNVQYFMPTGETIKRVVCNHDLNESTQNWTFRVWDTLGGSAIFSATTTGTAAHDVTMGSPVQYLVAQIISGIDQTPPSGTTGCIYGEMNNVMIYSEVGTITLPEVVKDCAAKVTSISTDYTHVGTSNTFSLVPFFTEGPEYISSIVERAAAYGDSSFNPWAVGLRESDSTGAPMAYCEAQPVLTDYDYAVRVEECEPSFSLVRDLSELYNWIAVKYRDEKNNRDLIVTPDDDATLKDLTSIGNYGQRDYLLDSTCWSLNTAKNVGRRFLELHKDVHYYVSGPVKVRGTIRGKSGNKIPASQIRAGKRIRIENFLQDLSGTGLTFLVSQTSYDDNSETCSISCGLPADNLGVFFAQVQLVLSRHG